MLRLSSFLLLLITASWIIGCYPNITGPMNQSSFSVDYSNNRFMLDGQPFQYISGSIHYFRIHTSLWRDRLKRVRALGFNAIQYYIPWNYHEKEEGRFTFSGSHNFTAFSQMANELGLFTLLRIGPYICGEWENGGLPWWLLKKNYIKMRTSDARFKSAVSKWFSILLPKVKPLLRENGGPVLMVQIENEYGSYTACNRKYTTWLKDLTMRYLGDKVILYTTDGNSEKCLKCGVIPGVLPTVDFGPCSTKVINESFNFQRKYLPKGQGPLVNSEFYPGWLVLWGQKTQSLPSTDSIISSARQMFEMGANVNFYMIHGGTNFGFWNGAETNAPVITSYDYSAPITEAGDITKNYLAIRNWIKGINNWKNKPLSVPVNNEKASFGAIELKHLNFLKYITNFDNCISSHIPLSFEELDHPMGYVLYYKKLDHCGMNLSISNLKDYGYLYHNGNYIGTFINRFNDVVVRQINLTGCQEGDILSIVVENQGRQTFETINDEKGILSDVLLDGTLLRNWIQCRLNLPQIISKISKSYILPKTEKKTTGGHGIYFGEFFVKNPIDTFIDTSGWGKGVAFVNGNNIGRYWASQGPQMTLYVPAALLRPGSNSMIMLELEGTSKSCYQGTCNVISIDHPIFLFDEILEVDQLPNCSRRSNGH